MSSSNKNTNEGESVPAGSTGRPERSIADRDAFKNQSMDSLLNMISQIAIGSLISLKLFAITLILAIPLGLVLALGRISRFRTVSTGIGGYIWLMRGTPLMLQMFFIYYALPMMFIALTEAFPGVTALDSVLQWMTLSAFPAAVIAFALNYAAYFAEIFRGGIQSIGKGQYEGARVLGLTYAQTMRRIILPQMIKRILAPFGNETITLVKDTSLVYVLTIFDLLTVARSISNRDATLMPFLIAAIFYLLMTFLLTLMFQFLEKRYAVYDD